MSEPDRYCVTAPDGSCTSADPRCMHNTPAPATKLTEDELPDLMTSWFVGDKTTREAIIRRILGVPAP